MNPDNKLNVPDRIAGLSDLAYNLWWSWNPNARNLFKEVDRSVLEINRT